MAAAPALCLLCSVCAIFPQPALRTQCQLPPKEVPRAHAHSQAADVSPHWGDALRLPRPPGLDLSFLSGAESPVRLGLHPQKPA